MKKAYSLLEILLTVSLFVVLAIVLILIFNPKGQINKAYDGKRKSELATLKKVLEDWYNDKSCYPKPSEICYPSAQSGFNPALDNKCYFCGTRDGSPSIEPYLSQVACDPEFPVHKYIYQVDDTDCPKSYWIYTKFSNSSDDLIAELGCQNGCGPAGDCNYNYGISSSNTEIGNCIAISTTPTPVGGGGGGVGGEEGEEGIPTPTPTRKVTIGDNCSTYTDLYFWSNEVCNICGTYDECKTNQPGVDYYSDPGGYGVPGCQTKCIKD